MFTQTGKHPFSRMLLSPDYAVHTKERVTALSLAEDLEIRVLIKDFGLPGPLVYAIYGQLKDRRAVTQRIIR